MIFNVSLISIRNINTSICLGGQQMIKKILTIGVSILLIISMVSCSKKDEKVDKYATKMDTIMHLTAYGPNAS